MRRSKFVAGTLIFVMAFFVVPTSSVRAGQSENSLVIQQRWTNAKTVNADLSFSGTTADCSAKIVGISETTKIKATVTLERKDGNSYTAVKTWSNLSASGASLSFSNTYTAAKGYTYRLKVTADVTCNGKTETVSDSEEESL